VKQIKNLLYSTIIHVIAGISRSGHAISK